MLIGDLARESGTSRDTIRYYEKRGLLKTPHRRDNNYKEYADEDLRTLGFIGTMKDSGFTLREITDMLGMIATDGPVCGVTGPAVTEKLAQLDQRIVDLRKIRARLKETFSTCTGTTDDDTCQPIADILTR
ncbi:MAG: MerR family transcriptional regulator [Candidatus Hydrogenedentes bacterium]|nr:MerR family transcriptional regulator [Candidatus Hydrogenedentota bacterium]